jgi:hypothetical protein
MRLELNDIQTEALIRELTQIIDNDRYPVSPRMVLKEIGEPVGALSDALQRNGLSRPLQWPVSGGKEVPRGVVWVDGLRRLPK